MKIRERRKYPTAPLHAEPSENSMMAVSFEYDEFMKLIKEADPEFDIEDGDPRDFVSERGNGLKLGTPDSDEVYTWYLGMSTGMMGNTETKEEFANRVKDRILELLQKSPGDIARPYFVGFTSY